MFKSHGLRFMMAVQTTVENLDALDVSSTWIYKSSLDTPSRYPLYAGLAGWLIEVTKPGV